MYCQAILSYVYNNGYTFEQFSDYITYMLFHCTQSCVYNCMARALLISFTDKIIIIIKDVYNFNFSCSSSKLFILCYCKLLHLHMYFIWFFPLGCASNLLLCRTKSLGEI